MTALGDLLLWHPPVNGDIEGRLESGLTLGSS
jgi:hypothetical protein